MWFTQAPSSYIGGEPSGVNCFRPPGPSSKSSKTTTGSNTQGLIGDENLLPLNQQATAPEPNANLLASPDVLPFYLPAFFGKSDGQSKVTAEISLSDEPFV